MPTLCIYFQVHQPYRVRKYSFFDVGKSDSYFDDDLDRLCMQRAAQRCYLPSNAILKEAIEQTNGAFRVSFSITGVALEQMERYAPEALESFRSLVDTGVVEILGETYYHSLASLFDIREFIAQIALHRKAVSDTLGYVPMVFRNTELLYSDAIAKVAATEGFRGVIADGVEKVLGWRSPNSAFRASGTSLPLILKNSRFSDDIAFRFSHGGEGAKPLTAREFVKRLDECASDSDTVGLFLDYETFGEHHPAASSILSFLADLPEAVLANPRWRFQTPSEVCVHPCTREDLAIPDVISWADVSRDASAWTGNGMQQRALESIFALREQVLSQGDPSLLETWRKLQISDHFYYMGTKGGADGMVHAYFSPFESPYAAFVAYMNVLRDFARRVDGKPVEQLV